MGEAIVVGVDGSARSRVAADWAAVEALRGGLPLQVAHVSPVPDREQLTTWPYRLEPSAAPWAKLLAELHPGLRVEGVDRTGEVVPTLLSLAAGAGLLVLGTRGEGGPGGPAVGSVAHDVAVSAPGPVVLVPDGTGRAHGAHRRAQVVCGFDARDPAGAAAEFAFRAAERHGVRLRVVHAWRLPSPAARWMPYAVPEEDRGAWEDQEVQVLSDALMPWRERHPRVAVQPDVVLKSPAAALTHASAAARLLVVGRGRGSLGAVAHAVLEHAACPVAVVPG
jgi:nucleotide-binding universal stress UspA family protein